MKGAENHTWEEAATKPERSGTVYSRKVGQTAQGNAQVSISATKCFNAVPASKRCAIKYWLISPNVFDHDTK